MQERRIMQKKIIKYLFLLVVAMGYMFIGSTEVKAETSTLTRDKVANYYYERTRPNYYFSYQHSFYTFNGRVAYCIEPGVDIIYSNYNVHTDLNVSGLTQEQLNKAKLIAYYGFEFPGHQTTKFRVATQKMLWESVSDFHFEYYTERYGNGSYINLSPEINEISNLVANHYKRPSFNGTTVTTEVGKTTTITDTNGVLSNFEVYGENIANVTIEGNNLSFTPQTVGDIKLSFVKKQYQNRVSVVYTSGASQKMLSSGTLDPVYTILNVNSLGGTVELNKKDSITKTITPSGEASLNKAIYGVYDNNNVLIERITTNENGLAISSPLPSTGTFYIQEISPSTGYQLDTTKYYFESVIGELHPSITVYENVINRDVEITKVVASNETGIMIPEVGSKFEFYNNKGVLVDTLTTNKDGKININLPYGTYNVKQITAPKGYEKMKDFKITITSMGEKENIVISNAMVSAKLKITKVDSETGDTILQAGVKFKIKNTDTNEYVKQTVTYPTRITYEVYETDEKGMLITPYPLDAGNYELEEISAPYGYYLDGSNITFTIDENSNIITDELYGKIFSISVLNKAVKGQIEIYKKGEALTNIENTEKGYNFIYKNIVLSGAVFNIYANEDIYDMTGNLIYSKDELVETLKSNELGYAITSKLHLGKYYILEQTAPEGYILDETKYNISLEYENQNASVVIKTKEMLNNRKTVELNLVKYGETYKFEDNNIIYSYDVLKGAIFGVYTKNNIYDYLGNLLLEENTLIDTIISNENGIAKLNVSLPFGSYYIKELKAPIGYIMSDNIYEFEFINTDTNNLVIDILDKEENIKNNLIKGGIVLTKKSSTDGKLLSDAIFEIYMEDGTLVGTFKTNNLGVIELNNIPYGKYYLIEKLAPIGYEIDNQKYYFEITENEKIIELEITNEETVLPKTYLDDSVMKIALSLLGIGCVILISYAIKKKGGK
ncbi:MAG: SpaA isopeptide-forming pilin-related protein [bacterium]|nr:SpaA isopeptide-forming pilin-related protein [bacterium]